MKLLGLLLVVAGVALGLYVGLWLCFIGGIIQIVNTIKGNVEGLQIALGILRIVGAGLAGWVSALILILPGAAMITKD